MNRPIVLFILGVFIAGCEIDQGPTPSLGTLENDRIEITADSIEPISEILVTEGNPVTSGDMLFRQDPARINAMFKKASADLEVARAKLSEAEKGPRVQEIASARARLAAAQSVANTALIELERERSLVQQNYVSQNNVDILLGRYESALARTEEVQAQLAELLEGTRAEEIDAARSQFAVAEANMEDVAISLDRTITRAPVNGRVESVILEIGERPRPGGVVVVLVQDQKPFARIHVPEPIRARIAPGQRAEIIIDGHAKPFAGRLRWVAHDANYTPFFALTQRDRSHLSYQAEVDFEDVDVNQINTGIPVEVYFPGVE